jgi:hypothetical protein
VIQGFITKFLQIDEVDMLLPMGLSSWGGMVLRDRLWWFKIELRRSGCPA